MTFVNLAVSTKRDVRHLRQFVIQARMPKTKARDDTASQMLREAGLRLAALREVLGMTQDQLAALLGVSRGALAMWEVGKNKPDPLALARAQRHGIPIEFVLLGLTRHVEHGHMAALTERCISFGVTLDGPLPEFPMTAETRGALSPAHGKPAGPPRRRPQSLHEPQPGAAFPRGMAEPMATFGAARPRRRRQSLPKDAPRDG